MGKAYLSLKLKDPQSYFMEDETIHCVLTFKAEKVLKEANVRVNFIGRCTSLSNGVKNHVRNIFSVEKDVSIHQYNNTQSVKKMNSIEFSMTVPGHLTIPSFRNLDGSAEGGKIEYLIEANLEAAGFLKKSVLASHIISVPIVGKVNINEDGLDRTRESSIDWPKNSDPSNTCVLYGWIPHEGILKGKEIPIRVEFKQPSRYETVDNITVSLVQQEIISSNKDSPPDMTKQLPDKIIKIEEKPADLKKDMYSGLFTTSKVIMFGIPSDVTPSIVKGGKVMSLDYKIRVTVKIPKVNGPDSKELSINIPVVVGTTGHFDSGLDMGNSRLSVDGHRTFKSNHSHTGSVNNDLYPGQPIFPGAMSNDIYPPPSPGFVNPYNQGYPPTHNTQPFVLNTQHMPYVDSKPIDVTRMPVPDLGFDNMNQNSNAMYPPGPSPTSSTSTANVPPINTVLNQSTSNTTQHSEAPINQPKSPINQRFEHLQNTNANIDMLESGLSRVSSTTTSKSDNSQSGAKDDLNRAPSFKQQYPPVLEKPNTHTPPQTPFVKNSAKPNNYRSSLSNSVDDAPTVTRIDPLYSIIDKK